MSQTHFAQLFDLKRTAIGAYEEGRAEPKIETAIRTAKHFDLTLDQILCSELTVNEIFHFRTDLLLNSRVQQLEKECEQLREKVTLLEEENRELKL